MGAQASPMKVLVAVISTIPINFVNMKYLLTLLFLGALIIARAQAISVKDTTKTIASVWQVLERPVYTIEYPSTWTIDSSKKFGSDMFAFSPLESESDNFRENVNVMIQDLSGFGLTLAIYADTSVSQIKNMLNNCTIVENKSVKEGNKEFHKVVFTGQQGNFTLKSVQYYFLVKDIAYIITLTTLLEKYDQYIQSGERMLNSFRLKE